MQTSKVRSEPTIPDHEVLRKIGGGAYGEVWLARAVTGALRAVKTVWYNDFSDERSFEREFEGILKYEPISRDHPGLVHILHVGRGEADGEPFYYYVMELGDDVTTGREINAVEYEPRTLRSDMKAAEGRALDVEECISSGRLVAEGLEHLHGHGLAHRDVKPSNVIFVDGKAKLADIGLVALRGQQTFVGTEGFVPPEGPGSAQADVYSLGKVLYEMVTGKDRLDFPELPDELPEGGKLKRWRSLNSVICDVCEPKISRRKIKSAGELAIELHRLEEGRRRPVQFKRGLVGGVFLAVVGVAAAAQLISLKPLEFSSDGSLAPAPPLEMRRVVISSVPDGATVFTEEGEPLGRTPLEPQEFPVGSIVSFVLKKKNHRDLPVGGEVTESGLILVPELVPFRPPIELEPWEDVFGVRYQPVESHHVSQYYVTAESWNYYLDATKRKAGNIIKLTENGLQNEVVLATPAEAKAYSKWLETENRETHLDDEHWFEVKMDNARVIPAADAEVNGERMRPFWCVVRKESVAYVKINSKPEGAAVYIQRTYQGKLYAQYLGVTPLPAPGTPDSKLPTVTLNPKGQGELRLIVEKPKFKRHEQLLFLEPNDRMEELVINLERENIFDFDREPLVNSLEMKLIPVGQDLELLASVWETRVRDYERYVRAMEKKVSVPRPRRPEPPESGQEEREGAAVEYARFVNGHVGKVFMPPATSFEDVRGPDHPVVNVTREEAELFCRWLTHFERRNGEIGGGHEYRLPTDDEWSFFVGLSGEEGDWPMERHGQADGFMWGDSVIPPLDRTGNFADQSLVATNFVEAGEHMAGYHDGVPFTAPVGQFTGRKVGRLEMFDLEGNVLEWVSDDYSSLAQYNVARGASWRTYDNKHLKATARRPVRKAQVADATLDTSGLHGFRVVLAKVRVITEKESEEPTGK